MSDKSAPSIAVRKGFGQDIRVSFSERQRESGAQALRRESGAQALRRESGTQALRHRLKLRERWGIMRGKFNYYNIKDE